MVPRAKLVGGPLKPTAVETTECSWTVRGPAGDNVEGATADCFLDGRAGKSRCPCGQM